MSELREFADIVVARNLKTKMTEADVDAVRKDVQEHLIMLVANEPVAEALAKTLAHVHDDNMSDLARLFYAIEALHLDQHAGQLGRSAVDDISQVCHLLIDQLKGSVPNRGVLLSELNLALAGKDINSGRTWHVNSLLERADYFRKSSADNEGLLRYYRGLVAWQSGMSNFALEQLREVETSVTSRSLWESSCLLEIVILRTTRQFGEAASCLRKAKRWHGMTEGFYDRLDWQQALLNLQQSRRVTRFQKVKVEHSVQELERWCWLYAAHHRMGKPSVPRYRTLQKRVADRDDVYCQQLLQWLRALELGYDRDRRLEDRLVEVSSGIEGMKDATPDVRMPALVAAAKWAFQHNQVTFGNFVVEKYRTESLQLTEGRSEDALGIAVGVLKRRTKVEPRTSGLPSRIVGISRLASGLTATYCKQQARRMLQRKSEYDFEQDIVELAVIIRRELGSLKGPLMKMGQTFSLNSGKFPEPVRAVFRDLVDSCEPLPFSSVEEVLREELGDDWRQKFATFDETPFAAASIGQVHTATTLDGAEVVVKVQYPGIDKVIRKDLRMLKAIKPFILRLFPQMSFDEQYVELVERLTEESDYTKEADYQEEFAQYFTVEEGIVIPRVVRDLSTKRVLVQERMFGRSLDQLIDSGTAEEKDRAAELIHYLTAKGIFRHGILNADPHPGNFLFDEGCLIVLDFGCVKRWEPDFLENWKKLLRSTIERDLEGNKEAWQALGYVKDYERFDYLWQYRFYSQMIYFHYLTDRPLPIEREVVVENLLYSVTNNPNSRYMDLPKDHLMALRVLGTTSLLLADLNARRVWRNDLLPLFYDSPEEYPAPLTVEEVDEIRRALQDLPRSDFC